MQASHEVFANSLKFQLRHANLRVKLAGFAGAHAPNRYKFQLGASLLLLVQYAAVSPRHVIRLKNEGRSPIW